MVRWAPKAAETQTKNAQIKTAVMTACRSGLDDVMLLPPNGYVHESPWMCFDCSKIWQ
jgi:hypothetical protein